ncbi:MAG TPA: toll/interleukin-1 receptor domain-containing protein, partial [Hyphomonadaceae bacterium]|nr:toll/interleukin-1 receptor domain-containing protein [Hyphomonadaceae bacterium]
MTFYRRPRVFLSYRHQERPPGLFGDGHNRKHREWIDRFAHALAAWNVDVIWDDRLRSLFRPHTSVDPEKLEFLAEASTLCLQSAQAFLPVLTAGYAERVAGGAKSKGIVTEEWQRALAEQAAGRVEITPIVREWPIPGLKTPPAAMHPDRSWDFRFVEPDKDEVELLADSFHLAWDIERPSIDMSFKDLISTYLKFCVTEYRLPWPGVETWGCNLDRPRIWIDLMHNMQKAGALKSAGADRDSMEAGLGRLAQEPRDEGLEKMKALMASAANTVAG